MAIGFVMDETAAYNVNIPSPSISYHYLYGDHDQYFEASHSDSHSSATSPYDMTFSRDLTGASTLPSPDSRELGGGSEGADITSSPAAIATTTQQPNNNKSTTTKRKRENRYKDAPPSVLSRRRAQNRASQRAYRERKDQRIKDLEQMLSEVQIRHDVLSQAYTALQTEYIKLKASSPPDCQGGGHGALQVGGGGNVSNARPGLLSSGGHHHHHHHHQQQQQQQQQQRHSVTSSPATTAASYTNLPTRTTTPAEMGARFIDPNSMAALGAGQDMGAYLFTDVQSYPHHM